MDIQLPGMSGTECASRLKEKFPAMQILIVTVYNDANRIFEALQAGASGYLLKTTPPAELLAAIKGVMGGGAPMTGEIARRVIDSFRKPITASPAPAGLTQREEECLRYLAQGYSNKEIAAQMRVATSTVHAHLKSVYEKLHVRSRVEAATKYFKSRNAETGTSPG
jgi:DNA-binding NarL/FixJ family response regulator